VAVDIVPDEEHPAQQASAEIVAKAEPTQSATRTHEG
jgi:hypothetical protein